MIDELRPNTLEDMRDAILAGGNPYVQATFMLSFVERFLQLEQQVADLSELARTANRRAS